jgi:hypothetical protein
MIRWARLTIAVAMIALLGGCAGNPPAVIENKSVPAAIETPEVRQATAPERAVKADVGQMLQRGPNYIVQPGDTLYAVAFRLGMDYRTPGHSVTQLTTLRRWRLQTRSLLNPTDRRVHRGRSHRHPHLNVSKPRPFGPSRDHPHILWLPRNQRSQMGQ